jgi:hypothetical protein
MEEGVQYLIQVTATNGPTVHPPGNISMDSYMGIILAGDNS